MRVSLPFPVIASAAFASAGLGTFTSDQATAADAPRIHLRGSARLDAHAARTDGKLALSGTVTDDLGTPTAGARIAIAMTRADANAVVPLSSLAPETCDAEPGFAPGSTPPEHAAVLDGADRVVVATDERGAFCFRVALPPERYVARLEVLATGLVDGARAELPVDLAQPIVTLRFDPARSALSLDEGTSAIGVLAQSDGGAGATGARDLALGLFNESGALLGQARTDASGRARFDVPSETLGPAGAGELRVAFGGAAAAGASAYALAIERRADVHLTLPESIAGKLPPGSPESGIRVRVSAALSCARRGCIGSPTGTIEARLDEGDSAEGSAWPGVPGVPGSIGAIVGAGTIEAGEAQVVVTFAAPARPADVLLRLRYVPDAPWFRPETGPSLSVLQPVRPPGPWRRVALAFAGLVVLVWLAIARLPAGSPRRRDARVRLRADEAGAERDGLIEHVSTDSRAPSSPSAAPSWSGQVRDAHDGTAIPGIRIAIERPGFEHTQIVAETSTDPQGGFSLTAEDASSGDRLVAEGPLHTPLRRPLPPTGELRIALVARRRAILERFVAWARRRGRPFDAQPDPTPRHVGRVADAGGPAPGQAPIRAWADAVEAAVFGEPSVDAALEREVDRLAPADAQCDSDPNPPRVHPASRRPGG